jgi:enolase-phosphatase E1
MPIRAILTDIEGTTSSIHFVHQVLFPYAAKAMPTFVQQHANSVHVKPWLGQIASEIGSDNLTAITNALLAWIAEDRKHTALKALQGEIWRTGYVCGAFRAHVYPEVAKALTTWAQQHLLYVYSSGSIASQKLFFGHSEAGNLLPLFQGFFDTTSGAKREADSYRTIARSIGVIPGEVLFLSDIEAELDAARTCGMRTYLLAREGAAPHSAHPLVRNFNEIKL